MDTMSSKPFVTEWQWTEYDIIWITIKITEFKSLKGSNTLAIKWVKANVIWFSICIFIKSYQDCIVSYMENGAHRMWVLPPNVCEKTNAQ